MTASAMKHDHNIIIIKTTESLKLFSHEEVAGRWIEIKICYVILFMAKAFQPLQCNYGQQQILYFLFVSLCEINCIKFRQ